MALTITGTGPDVAAPVDEGNMKSIFVDVTGDASYPTGGYAITPQNLGFNTIIYCASGTISPQGYVPCWNQSTQKLQFFTSNGAGPAALAEVPNTTNISTATARLMFWGI